MSPRLKIQNVAAKYTWKIVLTWKAIVERFEIILEGGDPAVGVFHGEFTNIAHSLNVSSAVVSRAWRGSVQRAPQALRKTMVDILVTFRKATCSLLNIFKRCKPSITHTEIIYEFSEFGDLLSMVTFQHPVYQKQLSIAYPAKNSLLIKRLLA